MRKAILISLLTVAALTSAVGTARAGQTVETNLTLAGFNNSGIMALFLSTDVTDSIHDCHAYTGSTCTAQHSYISPPKNIGNALCLPSGSSYTITENCSTLLNQGRGACHRNRLNGTCPK